MLTKPYSLNKIVVLVHALKENGINSKKKLEEKWKQDPRFLMSALALWIDPSNHQLLKSNWPPL